jgi:hypothetical protein
VLHQRGNGIVGIVSLGLMVAMDLGRGRELDSLRPVQLRWDIRSDRFNTKYQYNEDYRKTTHPTSLAITSIDQNNNHSTYHNFLCTCAPYRSSSWKMPAASISINESHKLWSSRLFVSSHKSTIAWRSYRPKLSVHSTAHFYRPTIARGFSC